jgi:hypothetical protein
MGRVLRLLTADEIEVKVKQVTEKVAIALIYKTSRVDMDVLDETLGAMNWTTEYCEIKGNLYCGIGIRENAEKPFVWKWDCGIESRGDDEGNEKKGEASDAFKRAGFKVGIGRELYSSPFIFLNVATKLDDRSKKYKLADAYDKYSVSKIEYDANDKISVLEIVNSKGESVFTFPKRIAGKKEIVATTQAQKPAVKQQQLPQPTNDMVKADEGQKKAVSNTGKLTRAELVQTWGLNNAEEWIAWLEKKIGYVYDDWTEEEHETARAVLKATIDKRKAEAEKLRKEVKQSNVETPF